MDCNRPRQQVDWIMVRWQRDADSDNIIMQDVAYRLKNMVQLTTDGLKTYLEFVEQAFDGIVNYAQLDKICDTPTNEEKTDNRVQYIGADIKRICGNPDHEYISTSMTERQSLTRRMPMHRFTRKTNAFSKKLLFQSILRQLATGLFI